MRTPTVAIIALGLATAGGVQAQQQPQQTQDQEASLSGWDYRSLYDTGVSARALLDRKVIGNDGTAIGTIADLVVGRDGGVLAVVVTTPDGDSLALPFPGDEVGWNPETEYLEFPYGSDVTGGLQPFAYGDLRTLWESRDLAPVDGPP